MATQPPLHAGPSHASRAKKAGGTLIKATALVEVRTTGNEDLRLSDRKLFNHLLAIAAPNMSTHRRHSTMLADIRRFAAEARDATSHGDTNFWLKESLTRLQKVLVQYDVLGSDGRSWVSDHLLGRITINETTGELTYEFPEEIAQRLVEPALYSALSLSVIYQFTSKYSLTLYEILKRYADRRASEPYWSARIEEVRDVLGCRDKLKGYKDFRKKALDPALEEINELAEFSVEMDEVRQGRGGNGGRVVGLVFRVKTKEIAELEKAVRLADKPRIQRLGEAAERQQARTGGLVLRDKAAVAALRWLEAGDFATRKKWAERARQMGVTLPAAATAPTNLRKWVPSIADLIVVEERLLSESELLITGEASR
ncbi:replication initiation protein [Niveispirillum fermenti]|uniref:replication initiation protein n=1 Tax=Niveispirillum fermenti TaxID=1233113 RepID=UPI003A893A1C